MPWDVASIQTDQVFYFQHAIPRESNTMARIATTTPAVDRALEAFLAKAVFTYAESGQVSSEWSKPFTDLKFVALQATLLDCDITKGNKRLFPSRQSVADPVNADAFVRAWSELRPAEITDELFAFFLQANPSWYLRLRATWITDDWKEKWLGDWEPESLEGKSAA